MRIICLSGFKGSGKDTAANYLDSKYDYTRYAFADILKDEAAKAYDVPRQWFDDSALKEHPLPKYPVNSCDAFTLQLHAILKDEFKFLGDDNASTLYWTPRALAILTGSIKRSVNPNYWVDKVCQVIKEEIAFGNHMFSISDFRYKSEAHRLKQKFGSKVIFVRISRFDSVDSTDASENDLNDYAFDYVIENRGTLEEFYVKLDNMMLNIKANVK